MTSHRLVAGHLAIRLDAMLKTVELPAGVPHLDARLANVDRDAFTLEEIEKGTNEGREMLGDYFPKEAL